MRFTLQCGVLIMSDINWDEAPEGATHYTIVDDELLYYKSNGANILGCYDKEWVDDTSSKSWIMDNIIKLPEQVTQAGCTKPIYTAAMCEAGTPPIVGMMVLCSFEDGKWEKVLIDFISEILVVVTDQHSAQYSFPIKEAQFKPIDTRTESDKGFDKFLSDEYNSNIAEFQGSESDVDFIVGLQSAWKAAINFKSKGE